MKTNKIDDQSKDRKIIRLEKMIEKMIAVIDQIDDEEPDSKSLGKMLSAWSDLDGEYTEYKYMDDEGDNTAP